MPSTPHTVTLSFYLIINTGTNSQRLQQKAICAYGGVKWVEPVAPTKPADGTIYRVQVGAFTVKENADKLKAELESKGYKPFIAKEEKP